MGNVDAKANAALSLESHPWLTPVGGEQPAA
jgi:hypothetical protein